MLQFCDPNKWKAKVLNSICDEITLRRDITAEGIIGIKIIIKKKNRKRVITGIEVQRVFLV